MPTGVLFSVFMLIVGVLGFALIGYALSYLADGKRFGEQLPAKKKVIVALAFRKPNSIGWSILPHKTADAVGQQKGPFCPPRSAECCAVVDASSAHTVRSVSEAFV